MAGPGEVDSRSGDVGPEPGADVLDFGHRRRPPRVVWLLAAALVVAAVVAVAVSRHGSRRPAAAPSPSAIAALAAPVPVGSALPLASSAAGLDVWASGRQLWVLQAGHLTLLDDLTTLRVAGSFRAAATAPNAKTVMVVDPPFGMLWVVVEGGAAGRVLEFNAYTLEQSRELTLPAISGAAALRGHLYVTVGDRLIDIPRAEVPRAVATAPAGASFGSIAADPSRSQLLLIDSGSATGLWVWRPGQPLTMVPAPLAFKASIAVVRGQVWIGGYQQYGAVLLQLAGSATGLTLAGSSPLTSRLDPGARIVASGQQVFWVRSGAGGADLWCVDADTGLALQHWNVDGAVASATDTAVITTSTGARRLQLTGCPG